MTTVPCGLQLQNEPVSARILAHIIVLMIAVSSVALAAPPVIIYNDIPSPLPGNVPSEGFQSDHTAEFGELIQFAGTNRIPTKVNVVMSSFALQSVFTAPGMCPPASLCNASGFSHPITLNLYNVNNSGLVPEPGTLIATRTQTFAIPWRPAGDPACGSIAPNFDPNRWLAGDGKCYTGLAFTIAFDLTSLGITLPNQIIYGIAYNTQTFGSAPIGTNGPFDALNVGLNTAGPSVGSNPGNSDIAYQNTDVGNGGTGTFSDHTGWTGFSVAASFETADTSVDLSIAKTAPPGVYGTGLPVTYTIAVHNSGPADAAGVTVTDVIPPGSTFSSATPSQGSCGGATSLGTTTITCNLGTLTNGASATIALVLNMPQTPGQVSNTATVSTTNPDTNAANNSSTATVTVVPASQIPALSGFTLLLLGVAMTLLALIALR
ncbi:MAG TPA: DUF11 domain-containing protein [Thermoanaerobaculia bacterium]|nr:DUF11 domain-containing protein [Thermoanaerobaculia bacterium]